MTRQKKLWLIPLLVLTLLTLSCGMISDIITPSTDTPAPSTVPPSTPVQPTVAPSTATPAPSSDAVSIDQIIFCEGVTEEGQPISPSTSFPAGTSIVWGYFTFAGMQDGQSWGRVWWLDSEMVADLRGETWEEGPRGWVAYSIEDVVALSGRYTLQVYVGDDLLQEASFDAAPAEEIAGITPEAGEASFSPITLCEDVTDDGDCLNPATEFPSDTATVWAYFTYEGMQDGQAWGRLWEVDGETYVDGRDDVWEDGASGWAAYYISDHNGLNGDYHLTLFIGDEPVQETWFSVAPPAVETTAAFSAFGPITFAEDVTDELAPVSVGSEFDDSITRVYALFPYMGMADSQSWRREWLQDGEVTAERDLEWDEGNAGVTYTYLQDEEGFEPGQYTLNLYIDGQLARSADFVIVGEPDVEPIVRGPANPEDIIDPGLMRAWQMLHDAGPAILRDLADFVLKHHIEMRIDPDYGGNAAYRYSCTDPPVPGGVVVSQKFWNEHSWEEVAMAIGHELTHAVQHMNGGRCGCSIEKEYYAYITQFYVLQELDRMDLLEEKYRHVYDENGKFDGDKLWAVLKKTYTECPDY